MQLKVLFTVEKYLGKHKYFKNRKKMNGEKKTMTKYINQKLT